VFIIGPHPAIPGRFGARARATVVELGNFSSGTCDGMAGDWAILRPDECLGKKLGFVKHAHPGPAASRLLEGGGTAAGQGIQRTF
jgi:hypothetical protein